ncbi:MAG TPA: DUF2752 domain-containing protein [Thermoanaerobaculia bacterium]|nr:DUF2752 domain-containing protein [Thermoanaerobaculia bacterium]
MASSALRLWALAGLLGLAGLAILHLWVPDADPRTAVCLSRRLFDQPCPGCGLTRAFAHLAKGEWREAVTDHPLAPFLATEFALGWLAWGAVISGRLSRHRLPIDAIVLANAAVLCALWLGRLATGTLPW